MLNAEIVVAQIDIEIGKDQLILDELPDDASHLIAIKFNNRIYNLDLRHDCDNPFSDVSVSDQTECTHRVALFNELVNGCVDAAPGKFADLQALHDLPLSIDGTAGERRDDAFSNTVRTIGVDR